MERNAESERLIELMKKQELITNMREVLRRRFDLFDEKHFVDARKVDTKMDTFPDRFWVGYSMFGFRPSERINYFDLNITGDTCFLLDIRIEGKLRGFSYGRQLYECVEEFARGEGCTRVVMFPSGTTHSGDTRRDYAHRLGYVDIEPDGEVEKILQLPDDSRKTQ